jgi:transcriptional regulator with XRE-family HTH domain
MAALLLARLEAIDMSQAEFARKAGVSPKHVNQVLTGKATAPLATLDYWAFVLGMKWSIRLVKL